MENQQKTPPLEDDTFDVPYDIIENILSRLPVKSLLRFKAVRKSWNATIKDPGLAKIHSNQLIISNSQCFYATHLGGDDTYSLIKFQGQEFYMESMVKFPLREYKYASFLCCCEGILVFKHSYQETGEKKYMLLNPFTRNCSTFSCPYDDIICASYSVKYGLCFDKYEDDYKFIVVLTEGKYLVYSIKNDTWVERQSELRGSACDPGIYVNGLVYWSMLIFSLWSHTIVYFDPKDGLLKKLTKPGGLEHEKRFDLTNLRGNLCLYKREESVIGIWLLKEDDRHNCWMKLATADNSKSPVEEESEQIFYAYRPIYLTSKNEVVFDDPNGTSYAVYCPDKQKFGEVKDFPYCSKMIMFTCLESLNFPTSPKRTIACMRLDQS